MSDIKTFVADVKKPEEWEIDLSDLHDGHIGNSRIAVRVLAKDYVCTYIEKRMGYMWNETEMLWNPCFAGSLVPAIARILEGGGKADRAANDEGRG